MTREKHVRNEEKHGH